MKINNTDVIKISNLYCLYNEKTPSEFLALRNINYSFKKNNIYCIIGKSGSGKSSLLNYFNGLSKPIYGDVKINDFNLTTNYNINNSIINEVIIKNDSISQIIFSNKKISEKQKIIIFQCAVDAKKYFVKIHFNSINRDEITLIKKINLKQLSLLNIKKTKNKIYAIVCDKDVNLKFPKILNVNLKENKIKVYNAPIFKRKKIKKYKELRKQIGVVYQFPEYQLFKPTVLEDVMFGPLNLGINKVQAKEQSIKTLEELGMDKKFLSYSPFGLSGGQKRRVALSGILAINPDILVFDEPTAGLDPKGEQEMIDIMLNSKKKGKTVFVVTHSMEQVLDIADQIIVIDDGEIIKSGDPYEVFLDKEVMKRASIIIPKTIRFIHDLVKENNKFLLLYKMKPRNVKELSNSILKINNIKVKHV